MVHFYTFLQFFKLGLVRLFFLFLWDPWDFFRLSVKYFALYYLYFLINQFEDFSDYKIVLSRLFKDKFTILNRQRLQIEGGPIEKRIALNEVLLNRSTVAVPEFEFSMNDDDYYFFPSAIVHTHYKFKLLIL